MAKMKLAVLAVLLAVFASVPAFAACTQGDCLVGPCACFVETGDRSFSDTGCSLWQFANGATRGLAGGDYFGEVDSGTETVKQEVWGGNTGNDIDLNVDIDVVTDGSPGTERLFIEVRSTSGTLLETYDIIDATDATASHSYDSAGYGGVDVVLQFRRDPGNNDGGTEFRIDNVYFWRCGF